MSTPTTTKHTEPTPDVDLPACGAALWRGGQHNDNGRYDGGGRLECQLPAGHTDSWGDPTPHIDPLASRQWVDGHRSRPARPQEV